MCGWRPLTKPAPSSLIAAVQLLDKPHTELIVHHSPYLVLQTIQPTTDPGEIKLRLNIKNRVTTWRIARIGGRGHIFPINHSSVYSLNKYVSVCVCVCADLCAQAPVAHCIGPIAHFKRPHQPQSFLSVDTPITLVKETRTIALRMLITSVKEVHAHAHTPCALHTHQRPITYTSPFCWRSAHLLQRHNANSCRCLSP